MDGLRRAAVVVDIAESVERRGASLLSGHGC